MYYIFEGLHKYSNVYVSALTLVDQNSTETWSVDAAYFKVNICYFDEPLHKDMMYLHTYICTYIHSTVSW